MKSRTYTNKPKDKVHKQMTKSDVKNLPIFIIPNNFVRDTDSCRESEVDESDKADLNELNSANQIKESFPSCVKKQRFRNPATSNKVHFTFIHTECIAK